MGLIHRSDFACGIRKVSKLTLFKGLLSIVLRMKQVNRNKRETVPALLLLAVGILCLVGMSVWPPNSGQIGVIFERNTSVEAKLFAIQEMGGTLVRGNISGRLLIIDIKQRPSFAERRRYHFWGMISPVIAGACLSLN